MGGPSSGGFGSAEQRDGSASSAASESHPGLGTDVGPKMRNLVDYLRAGYQSAQKPKKKTAPPPARASGTATPTLFSSGGEVPGRTVVEQDDHFHVTDHRGSFKVAKAGLDEATHTKIRGMCSGGEVRGYADGGTVAPRSTPVFLPLTFGPGDAGVPGLPPPPPPPPALDEGPLIPAEGGGFVRDVAHSDAGTPSAVEFAPTVQYHTPSQADQKAAQMDAWKARNDFATHGNLTSLQPEVPAAGAVAPPAQNVSRPAGGGGGGIPGLDPRDLTEAKATQAQASQQEQAALAEQGRAEHAAAMAQAEGAKAKATGEADLIAQRQRMEADRQQAITSSMTAYQQAVEEYGRTNIDPSRYWANANTGQKVLAGIGLLFGAMGAAHDGVNKSVGIINQAIDRDIEAQKVNLDKLGNKVTMRRGILGDVRAKFSDDAVALQATGDAYRQHAATLAEEMAARTQDPVRQAQLKALAAGVLGRGAEGRLAMITGVHAKAAEIAVAKQKAAQGWTKLRLMAGKGVPSGAPVDTSALDRLEQANLKGNITEYGTALDAAAVSLATQLSGGRAPRPASVKMIRDMLPGKAAGMLAPDRMRREIDTLKQTLRYAAPGKNVPGGGAAMMDEEE